MFTIINNPVVLVIIYGGFAIGITLLCLMLKLLRTESKIAVRIIGFWMVIYTFMFLVVPMLSEAIWQKSFLGKPAKEVLGLAIIYPFFNRPGIVDQCLTPIFPIELFFYCLWLVYFVSGIGILKFKNWGRALGVYAAEIAIIFSFGLWLYNVIFYKNLYPLTSLLENILPIGLPGLIFWILLTRNEVKAQFSRK